jgi:acetyl esterase/lipase
MIIQSDIIFGSGGNRHLQLDVFRPAAEKNLHIGVVQLHPGGFRLGNRKMLQTRSEALCRLGFTCFAAEYRLVTESPWPAQIHDVKAAIRWVRAHAAKWEIDPERIVLQGFSAGAHLALFAAGTANMAAFEGEGGNPDVSTAVAAVVAFYPATEFFFDPEEQVFANQYPVTNMDLWQAHLHGNAGAPSWVLLGLQAPEDVIRAASPLSYVSPRFPPTFLLHGTSDTLLPYESTVRFHERLQAAGVSSDLHLWSDLPHGFDAAESLMNLTQAESALFFRRVVIEPDLFEREFRTAMTTLMASMPSVPAPPETV